jgi:DNA-binding ferritin-like protein
MRRRLREFTNDVASGDVVPVSATTHEQEDVKRSIRTDNSLGNWESIHYGALSSLLAHLRFVYFVHQFHHWTASGDSFYGDHLLFQRLYEASQSEIDDLAEKAVGLGGNENVDLLMQFQTIVPFIKQYGQSVTYARGSELAKRSLEIEQAFLNAIDATIERLEMDGMMTQGLDDMLPAMRSTHEGHIYLLKQRVQ